MRALAPLPPREHFDTSETTLPSSNRLIPLALIIYLPLGAIAVAWAEIGQKRHPWALHEPLLDASYPTRLGISLLLGALLGGSVVAMTPPLVERARWARALQSELAPLVAPLTPSGISLLAIVSASAEELFFRGAMQPVLGLWWTSLIFGALHSGPKRAFLAWSVWAALMGLLFGWIFEYTGVLWGPVLAHLWINQRNMTYIQRH
jgi:membrane protease YdiL (CAAX protease family)